MKLKSLISILVTSFLLVLGVSDMSVKASDYSELLSEAKAKHRPFYGAQHHTLSNGMKVVVIANDRAPVLTHMVWYNVGGADEQIGISGTAHFLEHLLFKGTKTQEPGEFSRLVRNMGGRENAFTSWDYTAYFQTIPSEHLEKVMIFEADRMRNATPPEEDFLSERKVVLEERRQTLDSKPAARLFEQMRNALYVNHNYSRPIIGWMNEVERLEWSQIKAFYDLWYSPSNATLIVAGDVNPQELFEMAERIYGQIDAFDVPQNSRSERAVFDTVKELTMRDKLVKQKSFNRMAVSNTYASDPMQGLAKSLIGLMLDGGATSRLYKSIVVEQKKAVGVYFSYSGFKQDYGTISYGATPVEGVSFDTIEQAMLEEFKKAAIDGFTQEELARAKNRMVDSQIIELDSVTGPAMVFGHALMAGIEPDYLEYWTHLLDGVTLGQVNEVAAQILPQYGADLYKEEADVSPWRQSVYGYLIPQTEQEKTNMPQQNDKMEAQ